MAHILIIDDDPTIRNLFAQFLQGEGHDIFVAGDGQKGISVLESRHIDLVITDLVMPEMDGLELLLNIREAESTVPVIAISGGMRDLPINFMEHAKAFGADYVLKKPIPLDVLKTAVGHLLDT